MLHALCGISNSRLVFAAISGPPKGPAGLRVSAIRQGVTGMNCRPVGAEAAVPVPLSVVCCGEPVALSAMERFAESAPVAAGLNVIETVQEAPAASVVAQVVVYAKKDCGPLDQLVTMPPGSMTSAVVVLVFLRVTTCTAALSPTVVVGNVSVDGVSVAVGAARTPVPVSATVCGEPAALSATERLAKSAPEATGLKATEMVHEAPIASELPQVVAVWVKEVGSVPVKMMPPALMVTEVVVLVFFRVTTWAAVSTPSVVLAKVRLAGVRVTVGPVEIEAPVSISKTVPPVVPEPFVPPYLVVPNRLPALLNIRPAKGWAASVPVAPKLYRACSVQLPSISGVNSKTIPA